MSSRRCALRKSAASVRTLCTTPVPYSRPDARMVARLPMAGLSSRSEYSTRRDSKEADPVSWDAMSIRRRSVARSPCTCMATAPSEDIALPPPPSSSVNSSSRGASSPSIRRRRRAIADLNASMGKPTPETIPAAQITAAAPIGTNETVLAPSTAMLAESAIANTVTRSGLSRQPARSRSIASLARRSPTCSARSIAGGAVRRARLMASMRCEAPPKAMNTAAPLSPPAAIDVATNVGSSIAEPHALQPGQQQQADDLLRSHPRRDSAPNQSDACYCTGGAQHGESGEQGCTSGDGDGNHRLDHGEPNGAMSDPACPRRQRLLVFPSLRQVAVQPGRHHGLIERGRGRNRDRQDGRGHPQARTEGGGHLKHRSRPAVATARRPRQALHVRGRAEPRANQPDATCSRDRA